MTHDDLQNDLAAHLRGNTDRMVWCNTQLGPVGSPRPDVYTVAKSFSRFAADAYEIKVTVSDLRRDTTSGKWQSYVPFAHRVWFAFERGLAPLEGIPTACGVILRGPTGWRAARKPVSQALPTLPRDAWIKLVLTLHAGCPPTQVSGRHMSDWSANQLARRKWGDEFADLLGSRAAATRAYERETQRLEGLADELREEQKRRSEAADAAAARGAQALDSALLKLGQVLGVPAARCTPTELRDAVYRFIRRLDAHHVSTTISNLQALQELLAAPLPPEEPPC